MTTDNQINFSTDALVERLFDSSIKSFELLTVYIGDRLGLYKALAAGGPTTAGGLATRLKVNERYVREWLEQQAVASILAVNDPALPEDERLYSLPTEHAEALVNPDSPDSIAPLARMATSFATVMPGLLRSFREGGGVGWAAYGSDAIESQGDFNRPWLRSQLASEYLPAIPGIHQRLTSDPPASVLDMAAGVGWCGISIAKGYPKVSVVGIDVDASSTDLARANADSDGVSDRVRFETRDGAESLGGPYDLAFIVEAVHDMPNPVEVLAAVRQALQPGASLIVVDEKVAHEFTAPGDEIERFMYSVSVLCCLPAGMAESPSAATGTVMRPKTLERYATEAGFAKFEILEDLEHPFFRFYRLTKS